MSGMMLTARNETSGGLLDISAMSDDERESVHGARTAHRNGIEPVCRGCGGGVHLVVNGHRTAFWRHMPGTGRSCLLREFGHSESAAHLEAKLDVVKSLRGLRWRAQPEATFGAECRVDVYATHPRPRPHQVPMAWEIQISRQTSGDFTERTRRIRTAAGCDVNWLTPYDNELGANQGIVTDANCRQVVGRLHEQPDEYSARLPPMLLNAFVKAVARRTRTLLWSASGEGGRFIAYPVNWVTAAGSPTKPRAPRQDREHDPADDWDRLCDRVPAGADGLDVPAGPPDLWRAEAAEWSPEDWERFAPMAQARAYARERLDATDREALRRHPLLIEPGSRLRPPRRNSST